MTRCAPVAPIVLAVGLLSGLALTLPASAQMQRPFPQSALRGELRFEQSPQVTLNGRLARLAPGARIRGADNLLKLPASLTGQAYVVHYTVDPYGLLLDVWILTGAEQARQPWPTNPVEAATWRFNPAAQAWSRP